MRKIVTGGVLAAAIAVLVAACAGSGRELGPATPSSKDDDARMAWWRDARFGLFLHWGLYAIPAGAWSDGKGGVATNHGEWIRETAHIPVGEYEKLLAKWNPVKFDADAWARMAKDAGMKYVVITSKHHDGYCNFDSALTDWDVMSTPFQRDVMKELADACRRHGLKMCWYHSIMDWHHPDYLPRRSWEAKERPADGADFDRFRRYLEGQVTELLTKYGPIGVMWFDGEWESTWRHEYGQHLYDLCRRLQPDVIVNNRVDVGRQGMEGMTAAGEFAGDFGTPEQEIPATGVPGVDWETCMTMNEHWGFNERDEEWKSTEDLVRKLCDIASKGGNFLLNVGPRADGTFPPACVERLAAIGKWMAVNGEAIHGTTASPFDALPFGRCTVKAARGDDGGARSRLYLHVFDWPKDGHLKLPGLGNRPLRAWLLADPGKELACASPGKDQTDVLVALPERAPDPICSVVALEVEGAPIVDRAPEIRAAADVFVKPLEVAIVDRGAGGGAEVRFTIDGSDPTAASLLVPGPVAVSGDAPVTVKAATFRGGQRRSAIVSRTFTPAKPWPVAAAGTKPGLVRTLVRGSFDALPDVSDIVPNAETTVATIELGDQAGKENVVLSFDGAFTVPADDLYEFALTSDDGSRLLVDSRLVVDNDGLHGSATKRGVAPLAAGPHRIWLAWFNKSGGAELKLEWGRAGGPLAPFPASALSH
jgi:alpha-L-fucosidase